ncbi:MAG: cupin domain-containing protein [Chloroflexota bacterium]
MMDASIYFPDWRELIRYRTAGPETTVLNEGRGHKALLAGLEAGGRIPPHPERLGVYHVLEGIGSMMVDGARYPLSAGVTVIAPEGSARGFEAETRLAFIAVRVGPEPGSTP